MKKHKNVARTISMLVLVLLVMSQIVVTAKADSTVFNQYDEYYLSVPYLGKTVYEQGCGICSAASILNKLYDTDQYNPEDLARAYGNRAAKADGINYDSCASVAMSVLELHGVTLRKAESFEDLWVALAEGACGLGLMSDGFTSTPSGHFIALLGLNVDADGYGRIIVADSNGYNWSLYNEYDCWTQGFYGSWIWQWKGGIWICELEG